MLMDRSAFEVLSDAMGKSQRAASSVWWSQMTKMARAVVDLAKPGFIGVVAPIPTGVA
jgi:hypothetical protein